jgi:hypothetical protein
MNLVTEERSLTERIPKAQCLTDGAVLRIIKRERQRSSERDKLLVSMSPSKLLRYLKLQVKVTRLLLTRIIEAQCRPWCLEVERNTAYDEHKLKYPKMRFSKEYPVPRRTAPEVFFEAVVRANGLIHSLPPYNEKRQEIDPGTGKRWQNKLKNFVNLKFTLYKWKLYNRAFIKQYKKNERGIVMQMMYRAMYSVHYALYEHEITFVKIRQKKLPLEQGRRPEPDQINSDILLIDTGFS